MKTIFEQVFDYKAALVAYRLAMLGRLGQYIRQNPRTKKIDIARAFNCALSTVDMAMKQDGVKRSRGRQKWHYEADRERQEQRERQSVAE